MSRVLRVGDRDGILRVKGNRSVIAIRCVRIGGVSKWSKR